MRKKLTRDSFSALRSHALVLNEDQQRTIRGGGYFEDYGIGYLDGDGNYYWTRTREDNGSTFGGDYWDSISSSGSGSFYYDPNSAYGTSGNPISIDRYNSLAKMDRWNGGYVENFGYVGVYASSVDYGNSIFLAGSWYAYGDSNNPISAADFYKAVDAGIWHGGYVAELGYVTAEVTVLGSSGSSNSGNFHPIDFNQSSQGIGMAVLGALRAYDNGEIYSLDDLCNYSTGSFSTSGMGNNYMSGTFTLNGYSYTWYVANPPENFRDICSNDQNYTQYGSTGDGYFAIESCHQERNVIVIRCHTEDSWNNMYHQIYGAGSY